MEQTQRFYDFCIPYNANEKQMKAIINELYELGYRTIAIEQKFDHTIKDVKKRNGDIFPEPVSIKNLQAYQNQMKILQRLTILYTDSSIAHAMAISLNLKKYNLIAGQPKNDAALTHCCTTFNGDIITFDSEAGVRLMVNRKAYKVAIQRRMFFEIKYAPLIYDSNNRKDMIKIAHNYLTMGKSKNIIFSSGALNDFQVRGPYDVANLAFIFGLNESQGKNAIDRFCRQLFFKAESRRLGKTVMFIKSTGPIVFSDSSSDEELSETDTLEEVDRTADDNVENNVSDNNSSPEQPKIKKKKIQ